MRDAIVAFATRAIEKIRTANQVCGTIQVFIATDRFDTAAQQYASSATCAFMTPTADSRSIVAAAIRIFERLWRDGFAYRKAGVLLLDLSSAKNIVPSLFTDEPPQSRPLMKAIDQVNARFGRGSIGLGLSARAAPWRMRQEHLSPRFTTRWHELPVARIDLD